MSAESTTVTDVGNERTLWLVIGAMVALGLVLSVVTGWFWRSTRPDHPALAPLEVMGGRRFAHGSPIDRELALDDVRPEGAEPLRTHHTEPWTPVPGLDRPFAPLDRLVTFEDLVEPSASSQPLVVARSAASGVTGGAEQRNDVDDDLRALDALVAEQRAREGGRPVEPVDTLRVDEGSVVDGGAIAAAPRDAQAPSSAAGTSVRAPLDPLLAAGMSLPQPPQRLEGPDDATPV